MSFQFQFVFALILMSLISIKCDDSNEEPVELMTTLEPIDTANDLETNNSGVIFTTSIPVNCSKHTLCDTCSQNNCTWETCTDVLDDYSQCSEVVGKNCTVSSCEPDACKNVTDCEQCGKTSSCTWVQCSGSEEGPYCGQMAEFCSPAVCNATVLTTTAQPNDNTTTVPPIETTTVTPNDTTTTSAPPDTTTTTSPETTTTSPETTTTSPETTTITPETTTTSPETTTPPPSPDTTTSPPSPDTTTSPPSPDTTTTAPSTTTPGPAPTPSPQSGGFSAGSFFGGITLTLALLGVGLGGYKFYKTRYDVNYRTL